MAAVTVDKELCHAVAAWMQETVATDQMPVRNADGTDGSWEVKFPRIDSHEIYDVGVLDTLPAGVTYSRETDRLTVWNGRSAQLGARTLGTMEQREGALETGNPKGAFIDPAADRSLVCFAGYELSAKLDWLLTGENAGGKFFGRGSAHRACVKHLAEV